EGSHHHSHLAPFLHCAHGRSDCGARSRAHGGIRQPRRVDGAGWTVCPSVHVAGARLPIKPLSPEYAHSVLTSAGHPTKMSAAENYSARSAFSWHQMKRMTPPPMLF